MEYTLTTHDIVQIILRKWKAIFLIALAFAVLGAGYKYMTTGKTSAEASTPEEIQAYEEWSDYRGEIQTKMGDDLMSVHHYMSENPVMKLDASNCRWIKLTFTFDVSVIGDGQQTVGGWIDSIPSKELFGEYADEGWRYRNDLICVSGDNGEVGVFVYEVDEYDMDKAADAVEKQVRARAGEAGIPILSFSRTNRSGQSQRLYEIQDVYRQDVSRLYNELYNLNKVPDVVKVPVRGTSRASLNSLVKFGILGGGGGLILAMLFFIFLATIKKRMLSEAQVEDSFGLANLGAFAPGNAGKTKLLAATIRALKGDAESLMILGAEDTALAEALSGEMEIPFSGGSAEAADVETLETLQKADGVILPVKIGTTTFDELKKNVIFAEQFGKEVLGYVTV